MKKIMKNMLPYWKWILAILVLLVVQVYGDLSLPQYTSDIIDVGLTNHGIEHILPEKMTQEDYAKAKLFMTSEEKETFAELYEQEDGIYILTAEESSLETYDEEFLIPFVMTYQINTLAENAEDGEASDFTMSENMDISPEQLITMLSTGLVPDEQILAMREQVQAQVDAIGSSTLMSMGKAFAAECDENAGMDLEEMQMDYMWSTGGKMLLIAFLMMICAISVGYMAARVGAGIGKDLRRKTFSNVVNYSNAEMDKFSTASLITRSTNDIQQIQMVSVMILRVALLAPIMAVGGIIKVLNTNTGMEWIIVVAVAILLGLVMLLGGIAMPKFKIMQKLVDKLNLVSREILTGLSVIRSFGREQWEENRFDDANKELTKTQLFTNRVMTFMRPGMTMIMYGVTLVIVWVAAGRIDSGEMQVGQMTAFITYTMMIVMSFLMLTILSIMLPRAGVAAERIDEVIQTQSSIVDNASFFNETSNGRTSTSNSGVSMRGVSSSGASSNESAADKKNMQGVLCYENVGFQYPNAEEEVLSEISFTAEPGTTTAIIGSTGCGKSTLVNLMPRFYDVTAGRITLDGKDIRSYSLEELRDSIGFVPQKGVLFSGTIASNLRFGNADATEEELKIAAEIAQSADFIEEKNKKYESHIAQGGSNVSGGQKQRLAIARAIVKKPKVYVFDDSFSALDMKTDAKLRAELSKNTKDATVIIVAQRISTILHADQILVLDEGKIVGKGTHEELLRSCEVYEQIARSQLSAKELGLEEEV